MPFVPDQQPSIQSDPYSRNRSYAKAAPAGGYQTQLAPQDEASFQSWVKKNNVPFDPSPQADYDMRGFYRGLMTGDSHAKTGINTNDGKLHFSDYWKTPYHKSFSAESQWATAGAPNWNEKDQLVSPTGQVVFDERASQPQERKGRFVPDAPAAQQKGPGMLRQAAMAPIGAAEMLWQGATGAVASIPAGLAYGGAAVGKAFGADVDPSAVQNQVQSYLTHHPISDSAKAGNVTLGSMVRPIVEPIARQYGNATQAVSQQSPFAGELMKAAPGAFKAASSLVPAYAGIKNAMERPFKPTQSPAPEPTPPVAPTKEALKEASRAAYKRAEDAGVVIKSDSFNKAKEVLTGQLKGIDPTLHPDATAALKRITSTEGPVTLDQLETLRKIAKDAQGSIKPADSRLAGQIVETIDNYAETLGTKDLISGDPVAISALKEARNFWSRARKSDSLSEMMDRAQTRAGANYTQAGMEHALRQEFKTLALNQKRLRMFTSAEQEAIKGIARGGAWENSLRNLGKFDPSSGGMAAFMSALLAGGGAVPTGGASLLLPVAGFAAKRGATRITAGKVAALDELVRSGTSIPE
jgi:hypothetical protein